VAETLGLTETEGLADAGDPVALATTDGTAEALGDSVGRIVSLGDGAGVAHSGVGLGNGSAVRLGNGSAVGRGVNAPPWPNAST
jgi:hypothetical protein